MSTATWQNDLMKFLRERGKIQQFAELTAAEDLKAKARENQRNSEAESAHVRKQVWGEEGTAEQSEDEDVSNTILGDIHQPPATVVVSPPQQNNLWPVAALALAALLPVAGVGAAGVGAVAAYYLSGQKQPISTAPAEFEDSTVSIGLGKLSEE